MIGMTEGNGTSSPPRPKRPRKAQRDSADRRQRRGGRRHQGRILAMQILYEVDVTGHTLDDVLARTLDEQAVAPQLRQHVERLTTGVLGACENVDARIAGAATAFPVAQLAAIDRTVLRLAIFVLLHEPGVPPRVVINEAVELAKRFGGDNSSRFINGVLGTVSAQIAAEPPPERALSYQNGPGEEERLLQPAEPQGSSADG